MTCIYFVLEGAFTRGGLSRHHVRNVVMSPIPLSLHLLALQLKPIWLARFESTGASVFTPLSVLVLIQMKRRGRRGEEFERQRCADYTAICLQPWHADPLTPTKADFSEHRRDLLYLNYNLALFTFNRNQRRPTGHIMSPLDFPLHGRHNGIFS